MSRTLLTPQGDGNRDAQARFYLRPYVPHPPYPARGRKHVQEPSLEGLGHPREVPHPPYPARGRKHWSSNMGPTGNFYVPHPPYPARGRKRITPYLLNTYPKIPVSRTLLTPQGDGNKIKKLKGDYRRCKGVPHPPYPARGRKRGYPVVAAT